MRVRQSPSLPDGREASHRGETARYRDVFAVAEFRALWAAQVLSVGGDQLARVALTVLVYAHTGSALLAAAAYAASIAPTFLGGLLLSGLADRWPRRRVMIVCDLARVPLAALMAVPGMPTGGPDRAAVRGDRAGGAVRVGPRRHRPRRPRRRFSPGHGHHDDDLSGRPGRGLRRRRCGGRVLRRPDGDLHRRRDLPGLGRDRRPRRPQPPGPRRCPQRPPRTAKACWQPPGSCSVSGPSASRCCSGCCRRPTTFLRPSRCRWLAPPAAARSPPAWSWRRPHWERPSG